MNAVESLIHVIERPPLIFDPREVAQAMSRGRRSSMSSRRGGDKPAIFDPTTIPNMVVRYRASQSVTSSGGTLIDSIPNEGTLGHGGANVNDLAFSGARPKYEAPSATFQNQPCVLFDAVQTLTTGTLSAAIAQPSTFYAYTSIVDTNINSNVFVRVNGGTSANAATLGVNPSTDVITYAEFGANPIVSSALYGKHLSCVVYNGTVTAIYVDDMTTPIAIAGSGGTGSCVKITSTLGLGTLAPFRWPEQIGFGGAHNQATRLLVASYFTGTYG